MSRRHVGFRASRRDTSFSGSTSPFLISGLVWWLRADLGVTLNGSNVSAWADQSGLADANRNAIQGTAANQPAFNAADAAYNNQPTIGDFTSPRVLQTGVWATTYTPAMVIIVGHTATDPTFNRYMMSSNITQRMDILREISGGGLGAGLGGPDASAVEIPSNIEINSKSLVCVEFNGVSSKIYVNSKTAATTSTTNACALGAVVQNVGAFRASNYSGGKLAEILAYSRILSAFERGYVFDYIAARYAITITP